MINEKNAKAKETPAEKATKEDLSKQLKEAKCKAKFNWRLASTY